MKLHAESSSRLFLVCCVKLCSFDSWSWSGVCPIFLSIYLPRMPISLRHRMDALAPGWVGSPLWLRWRRRFTARPVWPFFSLPSPGCNAIIPWDGKGIQGRNGMRCVRNRIAIISMCNVAVVLQLWYRAVPCGHCIHASLGTVVLFSLPFFSS